MRESIRIKTEIGQQEQVPGISGSFQKDVTPLSAKEEHELVQKFVSQKDKKAVQKEFLKSFEWLVEKAITYLQNISPNDADDIRQVARIALISATENFDPNRSEKFSQFAMLAIWREIYKWQQEQTGIAIPSNVIEDIKRINKYLEKRETLETSDETIMEDLGLDHEKFKSIMAARNFLETLSLQQILEQRETSGDDSAVSHDEYDAYRLEDKIHSAAVNEIIHDFFEHSGLKEREKEILKMRFGLYGKEEHTLYQVGDILGVSRERIRQIEAVALRKIRREHPVTPSQRQKRPENQHLKEEAHKSETQKRDTFSDENSFEWLSTPLEEVGFSKDIIMKLKNIRWGSSVLKLDKVGIHTLYDLVKALYFRPTFLYGINVSKVSMIVRKLNENHIPAYKKGEYQGIEFKSDFLVKLRNFARKHDEELARVMEPKK